MIRTEILVGMTVFYSSTLRLHSDGKRVATDCINSGVVTENDTQKFFIKIGRNSYRSHKNLFLTFEEAKAALVTKLNEAQTVLEKRMEVVLALTGVAN